MMGAWVTGRILSDHEHKGDQQAQQMAVDGVPKHFCKMATLAGRIDHLLGPGEFFFIIIRIDWAGPPQRSEQLRHEKLPLLLGQKHKRAGQNTWHVIRKDPAHGQVLRQVEYWEHGLTILLQNLKLRTVFLKSLPGSLFS